MDTTHDFRFGVNLTTTDPTAVQENARSVEAAGFDLLHATDHLGLHDPVAVLSAAATATAQVRLGTLVLNNEFWNPALLARAVGSLDQISGGRFELGLGCGYMKSEFDSAGIAWRTHADRVAALETTVVELDRIVADDSRKPTPLQRPRPPLLIGAHGKATLELAARHADIVGFSGLTQIPGAAPGTFRIADSAETSERVEFVHQRAGPRAMELEFNVLIQRVEITDDAERTAAGLADGYQRAGLTSARDVLDNPFLLVGTAEEIATEILAARRRYGFTNIVTHWSYRDALAEAMPLVRRWAGDGPGT
ncbi:TIGR03621 family F420-dependent LLM class oxidoreductase [Lipingzhangella sp. LS1_29]|uniref:TIGR03621 family F420-dependent LLM class oxidoreductase n=1 Tax=Lipingzhangella rawalii TaxID=2055835 RepID=A0ABU2H6E8_9ACTN|nr:TIGR03621 family F420-dependent LLM class oxidoreductase [Lipingzhangella rawalii]MDS1270882.1 TIGR03621 family F420-dependent LLM class oxidoreductase [Lipingzhangella rawalii]